MSDFSRSVILRGQTLPIECTHRFSFGKSVADQADLPDGWHMRWIQADDAALEDAGFHVAAVYIVDDGVRQYGTFDPDASTDGDGRRGFGHATASVFERDARETVEAHADDLVREGFTVILVYVDGRLVSPIVSSRPNPDHAVRLLVDGCWSNRPVRREEVAR